MKIRLVALIANFVVFPCAEADIYKWVDREGKAHYSDSRPEKYESEKLQMESGPSEEEVRQSQQKAEQILKESENLEAPEKMEEKPLSIEPETTDENTQKQQLSLEELDRRCEEAREEMIAPLRATAIKECIANEDLRLTDPAEDCERFYEDYGSGGVATRAHSRPRMFQNLPECVEAFKARSEE